MTIEDHPKSQHFQAKQIVYLQAGDRRLYGEVVQYIQSRGRYWIRPLCLVENVLSPGEPLALHQTADVFIAAQQLEAALDTDILACWHMLYDTSMDCNDSLARRRLLQNFLRSLDWSR